MIHFSIRLFLNIERSNSNGNNRKSTNSPHTMCRAFGEASHAPGVAADGPRHVAASRPPAMAPARDARGHAWGRTRAERGKSEGETQEGSAWDARGQSADEAQSEREGARQRFARRRARKSPNRLRGAAPLATPSPAFAPFAPRAPPSGSAPAGARWPPSPCARSRIDSAPPGHRETHAPHPTHARWSNAMATPPIRLNAPTGQLCTHACGHTLKHFDPSRSHTARRSRPGTARRQPSSAAAPSSPPLRSRPVPVVRSRSSRFMPLPRSRPVAPRVASRFYRASCAPRT